MNTLLLFFALPVATIILAVVLEKILRNPFLTSATFFAIYLIIAFAVFDASFLVYTIAYTILAFIAAFIAEYFCQRAEINERRNSNNNNNTCGCNRNTSNSDVATVNVTNNTTGGRTTWCCYRR
mgnify:CR=1 FL=1